MISLLGNLSFYLTLFFIIIFYLGWERKIFLKNQVLLNLIYLGGIIPFIFLVIGFTISDFSILNVIQNSYIDDPLFFKITSAWGSHEGSILLWIFLINFFGFIFLRSNNNFQIHKQIIFISSLFILYLLLSSNPFVYVENSSEIVAESVLIYVM